MGQMMIMKTVQTLLLISCRLTSYVQVPICLTTTLHEFTAQPKTPTTTPNNTLSQSTPDLWHGFLDSIPGQTQFVWLTLSCCRRTSSSSSPFSPSHSSFFFSFFFFLFFSFPFFFSLFVVFCNFLFLLIFLFLFYCIFHFSSAPSTHYDFYERPSKRIRISFILLVSSSSGINHQSTPTKF